MKRARSSRPGTQGEIGFGHGLNIVALYVSKLGGTLEIMNREDGGAATSVLCRRTGLSPKRIVFDSGGRLFFKP